VVVRTRARQQEIRHRQPAHAEGQEIVRRLALDADIVIENFRPGHHGKVGVWATKRLAADNPGLIMLRLSGFGPDRPLSRPGGFWRDVGESHLAGCAISPGYPDRPRCAPTCPIGDSLASLHGVIGRD